MAPIVREIKQWWLLKSEIKFNKETKRLLIIIFSILILLLAPWKSSMKIPAVYVSEKYSKIYSPYSAQIKNILVQKDEIVKKGQPLIELYSPNLEDYINSTRRKLKLIKTKLNRLSDSAGNMDQYITYQQRLVSVQSELHGLLKIQNKMIIRAPFSGSIKDLDNLSNGMWVSNKNELFGIVHYGTGQVTGFVKEEQIDRFKSNNTAVFIPNDGVHKKINLISRSLDFSSVGILPYLSLSSTHKGPIAVRLDVDKEFENRPETAYYSANFRPVNKTNIEFELPGYVHVDGYRYSPFLKMFKNIFSLLIRESGF